jgi:NAD(P)-dependent dehydrogenase (short-subunit alcohol dehydrogenase family)
VTKAAVNRMTEALAVKWVRYGIDVNAIAPGAFPRDRGVAAADAATPDLAGPVLSSGDAAIGVETLLTLGPDAKPAFRGR